MSIKISLREPHGKNMAKLLHALADYIDTNQALDVYLNLGFVIPEDDDTRIYE